MPQNKAQNAIGTPLAASATSDTSAARVGTHFFGLGYDSEVIAHMQSTPMLAFAPVGTTSVVLKTRLSDDTRIALRPRSVDHPRGWIAEIAAFRIARFLGMDEVPPVAIRSIKRAELHEHLDIDDEAKKIEFENRITWASDGTALAAAVPWISGMQESLLDTTRIHDWPAWLQIKAPPPPDDQLTIARDLSVTLCFDWLIGNFDRFSGGNLRLDESGKRIVIRDHNLAFVTPFPEAQMPLMRQRMQRVERFSSSFVTGLRALDEAALRQLFVDDENIIHEPLLNDAQINDVMARRAELLGRLEALSADDANESARILFFP